LTVRSAKRSPARRWFLRSLPIIAIALCLALALDWRGVLTYLGNFLVSPARPQSADVILVLAGDFYGPRVVMGAELGVDGYAPRVLISGTPYSGGPEIPERPEGEWAIEFLTARGYPRQLFESIGHRAHNTIDEAIALRPELTRRRVRRVLLVTAAYHSRRAGIVFRLFCPGIQFIAIAAPDAQYHSYDWWEDAGSKKLFYSEWTKILGTVLIEYPKYLAETIAHIFGS
jgi:uncharacterized SAM-binding protein YcdF (DUF218 family)